nr:integrase [uncultured Albidiferax sp.]
MATKIDTVTARDKLKIRREPYWHRVEKGAFLGYRKMMTGPGGTWIARLLNDDTGKQGYNALGDFSDMPDHLRFDAAKKAADEWFKHRSEGGSATVITVGEACQRYVQKQIDENKLAAAKDLDTRFKRWMYADKKLSDTPVMKLTQGMVNDWRVKLTKAPALLQDKNLISTKPKSASSINREMAVFKAALNLAMRDGYATSDTAWKYKLTPIKNATGRRDCYLDITQRRALIASSPADLAALLRALSLVPFRPGALASLTAGSFDKRLNVLTVGKDKAGGDRKINLPPATAAFFAEQATNKLPGAPLISQANGKFWDKDAWKKPFRKAATAANLPDKATAYALRHSTITDLIALHHLDTMTVAQLSGTSVMMIEKHYGHLLHEHASNALALLAL